LASLAILRGWPISATALDAPDADHNCFKLKAAFGSFFSVVEIRFHFFENWPVVSERN
jgi:hypothetical protein